MARPATAAVRLLTGEREPVRLATTGNISLCGLQTIDGVPAEVGDRVLVKDQAAARDNGIYTASEGQWFRAADARTSRTLQKGTTVHVQQGTTHAGKSFLFNAMDPVIGDDALDIIEEPLVGTSPPEGRAYLDVAPYVSTRAGIKALDTTLDMVAILTEAGRQGTFKWTTGNFSIHVAADTLEGVYLKADAIASTVGAWVRVNNGTLQVDWFGASPNTTTDSQPAIMAAYNLLVAISGTTEGSIGNIAAMGGKYRLDASLSFSKPVTFVCPNYLEYTPTTLSAVIIGAAAPSGGRNTGYDIDIRGIRAINGNLTTPNGVNLSGCSGLEIRNCQFSRIRVGMIIAFTKYGFWGNQANNVYTGQHCQDNLLYFDEIAVCGTGVYIESVSGADGAFQVNEVHFQNVFGNWIGFNSPSGDVNTNNNHFHFSAMDAATGGGQMFISGSFNTFYFGYTAGAITLRTSAGNNRLFGHNLVSTGNTILDSGTRNLIQDLTVGTSSNENWKTSGLGPLITAESSNNSAVTNADLIDLYRSFTMAANDRAAGVKFSFNNASGNKVTGARMRLDTPTTTAGAERARLIWETTLFGAIAERMVLDNGLYIDSATGGAQGVGTFNLNTGYYIAGVAVLNAATGLIVPTGKVAVPQTNDGAALGTTALQWADLFLASGGVINFNNGNYTVTHSAGALTMSGALVSGNLSITASTVPANGMYLGSANTVTFAANTTALLNLSTSAFRPFSSGLVTLGSSANPWGDTFIKSTGRIDFGSGDYTITHSAGALAFSAGLVVAGGVIATGFVGSNGAAAGVGYATGAGGTVTQATSKSTGVSLAKMSGAVTMNAAALAAGTIVSFVLTNAGIAATDVLVLNHISGGTPGSYTLNARAAAGSATIDVRNNTAGPLSEAIVIQFAVIKAVNA